MLKLPRMKPHLLLLLTAAALLAPLHADAQESSRRERLRQHIDSLQTVADTMLRRRELPGRVHNRLDRRDERARLHRDSNYIVKPADHWNVKLRANISGTNIHISGTNDGADYRCRLGAQLKTTMTLGISWRGFSTSVALNPLKLAGLYKDYELNLNAYGNRFGVDAFFSNAKNLEGTATLGDEERDIAKGVVSQRWFNLTAYYSFNHRRFSFPAAFSQSQIQVRSAGSFMLGATWLIGRLASAEHLITGQAVPMKIHLHQLGIGAGYGYNFVLPRGWMIHVSDVPHLVLYNRVRLLINDAEQKAPFRFPNVINIGRLAVVRNVGNHFYGFSGVVTNTLAGNLRTLRFTDVKWMARASYGIRF